MESLHCAPFLIVGRDLVYKLWSSEWNKKISKTTIFIIVDGWVWSQRLFCVKFCRKSDLRIFSPRSLHLANFALKKIQTKSSGKKNQHQGCNIFQYPGVIHTPQFFNRSLSDIVSCTQVSGPWPKISKNLHFQDAVKFTG